MIRKEIFCSVVVVVFLLSSCQSGRRCKGGGWYGNRNLTQIDQPVHHQNTPTATAECEIICEP